jgi:hypothetical protein
MTPRPSTHPWYHGLAAALAVAGLLSACSKGNARSEARNWGGGANTSWAPRDLGKIPPPILSNVPRLGAKMGQQNAGFGTTTMKVRGQVLPSVATPSKPGVTPPGLLPSPKVGAIRALPSISSRMAIPRVPPRR